MNIIFDARSLRVYPVGKPGFRGGTERYLEEVAGGLSRDHDVHIITPDLDEPDRRGPYLWYWPPHTHPTACDVYVPFHNTAFLGEDVAAEKVVFASNGLGAFLPSAGLVDRVATFSQCHSDLLTAEHPVFKDKCVITGLGVDLDQYPKRMPEKKRNVIMVGNDPARYLWGLLDIFEHVRRERPDAELWLSYLDVEKEAERYWWGQNAFDETMREALVRVRKADGVRILGKVDNVVPYQCEAGVHVYPSDPPNLGSQIHGIMQMEMAAAWTPLVLSDVEAFPEVFGGAATILPRLGSYSGQRQTRWGPEHWAYEVCRVMKFGGRYIKMARAARRLAEEHTWQRVVRNWSDLLKAL